MCWRYHYRALSAMQRTSCPNNAFILVLSLLCIGGLTFFGICDLYVVNDSEPTPQPPTFRARWCQVSMVTITQGKTRHGSQGFWGSLILIGVYEIMEGMNQPVLESSLGIRRCNSVFKFLWKLETGRSTLWVLALLLGWPT